jgi:hypothetical protein
MLPVYILITAAGYAGAAFISEQFGGAMAWTDSVILAGTILAQFLLDNKKLENWHELYQWFVGIAAPTEFNEWCEKKFEYTDAVLHLYTSQQNKFAEVVFTNLVPVDLGDLSFTSQTGENDQITCTATFNYQSYKIKFTNDLHQEDDFEDQDRYTKANGNIDYEIRRY